MFSFSRAAQDRIVHSLQGAGIGAIALMIGGSYWPGWSSERTIEKRLIERDRATLVRVLAPVCANQFRIQPNLDARTAELRGVSTWQRDRFLVSGDYVVKSGIASTDEAIGGACADLLNDLTK